MKLFRLYHTLKYLKPKQITARLARKVYTPALPHTPNPKTSSQIGVWQRPISKEQSLLSDGKARFINDTRSLHSPDVWNDLTLPALWLYNLHYFDDLACHADDETHNTLQSDFITRWINENPPAKGVGWDAYPTSLRICNLMKFACNKGSEETLKPTWLESLALQAAWLEKRVEWHLLGNHLFTNAKALIFAGIFFDNGDAQRWLDRGLSILSCELDEQFLSDGGHFERSPMYHAIMLEDCLDIINLATAYGMQKDHVIQKLANRIPNFLSHLTAMTHPDGDVSSFNDSAIGIAAKPNEIYNYAARLGFNHEQPTEQLRWFEKTGYARADAGGASLIVDMASIGPDYLPGHAHADTLSFELSLGSKRIIVNGGTSEYGISPERERQRSTAAHSTVVVNGENSSEVWSGFRVARRARIIEASAKDDGKTIILCASHDGYKRLSPALTHKRTWHLSENQLDIWDEITGGMAQASAFFHFAPHVVIQQDNSRSGKLLIQDLQITWHTSEPAHIINTSYHPQFGQSQQSQSLEIATRKNSIHTRFLW